MGLAVVPRENHYAHLTVGAREYGLFHGACIHFEQSAQQRRATILTLHAHACHTLLSPDIARSTLMGAAISRLPMIPEGADESR